MEAMQKVGPSQKIKLREMWFRSTDLWVMGPSRFHCAISRLHATVDEIKTYIHICFHQHFIYDRSSTGCAWTSCA
jgi:hypothetical protein